MHETARNDFGGLEGDTLIHNLGGLEGFTLTRNLGGLEGYSLGGLKDPYGPGGNREAAKRKQRKLNK